MIRSVASLTTLGVRGLASRSSRSTGSPAFIVICLRGNRCGFFAYGARISCAPHWPTGITGQPVSSAIRAAPVLPRIGHRSGSRVMRALGVDDHALAVARPPPRRRRRRPTASAAQPLDRDLAGGREEAAERLFLNSPDFAR